MNIEQDEYNFVKKLEKKIECSKDEALQLKNLYSKYINEVRARILDHTCPPCVSEMFADMCAYCNDEKLIILNDN